MAKTREQAVEALTQAKVNQQEVAWLRQQIMHQKAIVQALWTFVQQKLNLSEEELAQAVARIEKAERETRKVADLCPQCGRSLQDNRDVCIYCGHAVPKKGVF
jgi:uncharacterized protein with PIN domain